MAFSVINHNNKEVLFVDHRGLSGDELLKSFKAVNKFLKESKKEFVTVSDFTDTTVSSEFNEYLKSEENKEVAKYHRKLAVVGITGIKKMLLGIYNTLTGAKGKMFDTVEQALEYVTKD
jgi:predicted flavoprotein YhiN